MTTVDGAHVPHLCPWSYELLDALRPRLAEAPHVHDPFAGSGERLGALCDEHSISFSGTELEPEWIADPRVRQGNSLDPATYPAYEHWIVTSPVYPNGMADHFQPRDASKRMTYRARLGRALHADNAGRHSVRGGKRAEASYWDLHRAIVQNWPDTVIVNVKDFIVAGEWYPLVDRWAELLMDAGYQCDAEMVACPGHRNGANRDLRADSEALIFGRHHRESVA